MTIRRCRSAAHRAGSLVCLLIAACWMAGCGGDDPPTVVVYTSVDPPFAREVFAQFEKDTGIRVEALTDTESSKTTGLVERLLREKSRPRADVWWSGEWFGTQQLANAGVLAEYRSPVAKGLPRRFVASNGMWTAFAARPRVLVYHTKHVRAEDLPASIEQLTRHPWTGRVTMAKPLHGTTRGWAAAMLVTKGEVAGKQFLRDLRAACPVISAGNSDVVHLVARAASPRDVVVGLTDADDVWVAKGRGDPVGMIYLDQGEGQMGTFLIPNSAGRVRGGPNPKAAIKAIDYLISAKVERMLAESRSRNVPLRPKVAAEYPQLRIRRIMQVEPAEVARVYANPAFATFLRETFGQ